jgi:hypothetical protein
MGALVNLDWLGPLRALLGQGVAIFDQGINQAREWQPLLAGALVLLAAIIVAVGLVRAAQIRATATRRDQQAHDIRTGAPATVPTVSVPNLNSELEALRSLLRSALACLSSVDTNHETARMLCARIAALQDRYIAAQPGATNRLREASAVLVNQFDLLRAVLGNDWSPSEASAVLIQINASARSLSAALERTEQAESVAIGRQSKS